MKIKHSIASLLFISLLLCLGACKKYKKTVVKGRLVNIPIERGIPNETVVLKSYSKGGFLLPDDAQIDMTTRTDKDGNFEFIFDAYTPYKENKKPSYSVDWVNLNNKKQMLRFSSNGYPYNYIDLYKFYNDDLLGFAHIDEIGNNNFITINLVLGGTLRILCSNELLNPSATDKIEINFINQFGEYFFGGYYGTGSFLINDGQNSSGYFPGLVPGETTIRANITKNGNLEVRDTTFFVEDKEYYLVYRY
jgi:hypothetical protein